MKVKQRVLEVAAVVMLVGIVALAVLSFGTVIENRLHPGPWSLLETGCGLSEKATVYLEDLPVDRFAQVCGFDLYYRGSSEERGGMWHKFKFVGYGDEKYLEVSKDFTDKQESRVIIAERWIGVVWLNPKSHQITFAADYIFKEKKPV